MLEQRLGVLARGAQVVAQAAERDGALGGHDRGDALAHRGDRVGVGVEGAADPDGAPVLSPAGVALEERLRAAGHEPPSEADLGDAAAELAALRDAGRAVRVGRSMYAHADAIAGVRERVVAIVEAEGAITLARLRDVTRRLTDDSRVRRRRAG